MSEYFVEISCRLGNEARLSELCRRASANMAELGVLVEYNITETSTRTRFHVSNESGDVLESLLKMFADTPVAQLRMLLMMAQSGS